MKNIIRAVAYAFVLVPLCILYCIVGVVTLVSLVIFAVHYMANSFICSLLTPTIQSTAAKVKENFCIPRRKLVAFKIEKNSPNGIKLRDISSGACSTYEGTDLRGILQHATYDEEAGEHFFPGDALACFESSHSERLFYGHRETFLRP